MAPVTQEEVRIVDRKFLAKILPARLISKSLMKESEANKANPQIVRNMEGEAAPREEKNVLDPLKPRSDPVKFRSYPVRWWLVASVVFLNLANYSHWVAFPSVTKIVAKYYDQNGDTIDLIPTLSYGLGIPCCVVATFVAEKYGLKACLRFGGILTGLGGLLCCLSSMYGLADGLSSDAKYYLALIGQALTGVACPFISCVPTKVSQHWFNDSQRHYATMLIGMANPMGIVLGCFFTPMMVKQPEDVALMNIVWFIPAALGAIITIWKVKDNYPPTPPSLSAAKAPHHSSQYLKNLRLLFTNKAFIIIMLFVGAAMGYISTISTKIEQILCARGYSDQLAGLSSALILFSGTVASFPFGILVHKTHRPILICKVCGVLGAACCGALAYCMRVPDAQLGIVFSSIFLGIFALGVYPTALELIVECTYPLDQATSTALIFLSSAIQGVLLMQVENGMGRPLNDEEMLIQTCVEQGDHGHQQPKNYSSYLNFITIYMSVLVLIFIVFFRTELKRTKADKEHEEHPEAEPSPQEMQPLDSSEDINRQSGQSSPDNSPEGSLKRGP